MSSQKFSPTYVALIDLLYRTKAFKHKLRVKNFENNVFTSVETEHETVHTGEDFYMNASELWAQCTPHEWHLIGRIGSELQYLCALWCCADYVKKSSANRRAITSLISKNILIKTETTNVYLVNPRYIRRGDVFSVINSTARMLQDVKKVLPEHVKGYKSISEYTPLVSQAEIELFKPDLIH